MSMNPEQENFQELRRLLALKRHEQPPPGYFNGFSREVIARIRAGERLERESLVERFIWDLPWVQRLWGALETKPAVAAGFGVVICGLLAWGALYSENGASTQVTAALPSAVEPVQAEAPDLQAQLLPNGGGLQVSSAMEAVSAGARSDSLFEEIRRAPRWRFSPNLQPQAQPVMDRVVLGP